MQMSVQIQLFNVVILSCHACKTAFNFFQGKACVVTRCIDAKSYFLQLVQAFQFADIHQNWQIKHADLHSVGAAKKIGKRLKQSAFGIRIVTDLIRR